MLLRGFSIQYIRLMPDKRTEFRQRMCPAWPGSLAQQEGDNSGFAFIRGKAFFLFRCYDFYSFTVK